MSSVLVRFTLVAVVAVAAGCNKVSQDQFDQSMAQVQARAAAGGSRRNARPCGG